MNSSHPTCRPRVVSVLRRRWLAGDVTARCFSAAIDVLVQLSLTRFPTLPLMRQAYELRANVTAYTPRTSHSQNSSTAPSSRPMHD